jgi:hypothetical protein
MFLLLDMFIEYYVTFLFREQQTALMAQMQAKLVKEKQANEKVSVVHCTLCVDMPEQHHERLIGTLDCSSPGQVFIQAACFTNH